MKQIWPNYSYSPATNVLTLTGLNIDRDQLLLVTAADRGRIMYNFADSSVTASAFTSGANTALTLVATTAGLTTTAALVIYYDDQLQSTSVSISNLPSTQTIAGTVTANNLSQDIYDGANDWRLTRSAIHLSVGSGEWQEVGGANGSENPLPISGTVTANVFGFSISENAPKNLLTDPDGVLYITPNAGFLSIGGTVTANLGSALPTGTNRIGVVTIGAGTVTIGAGTAQIGSVTASISGTVPVSGTFFQATQPVSLTTLPALVAGTAQIGSVTVGNTVTISGTVTANPTGTQTIAGSVTIGAGTAQIGSVTASISNSVTIASFATSVTARLINPAGTAVTYAEVGTAGNPSIDVLSVQGVTSGTPLTIFNHQGTTVTTSNFTSTTASTVLASANTSREVLTIFNEGAGNLHICAGATCTTIAYQVRLSAGDYYEVPLNQTSLTHSAVFATAGTARIVQIS